MADKVSSVTLKGKTQTKYSLARNELQARTAPKVSSGGEGTGVRRARTANGWPSTGGAGAETQGGDLPHNFRSKGGLQDADDDGGRLHHSNQSSLTGRSGVPAAFGEFPIRRISSAGDQQARPLSTLDRSFSQPLDSTSMDGGEADPPARDRPVTAAAKGREVGNFGLQSFHDSGDNGVSADEQEGGGRLPGAYASMPAGRPRREEERDDAKEILSRIEGMNHTDLNALRDALDTMGAPRLNDKGSPVIGSVQTSERSYSGRRSAASSLRDVRDGRSSSPTGRSRVDPPKVLSRGQSLSLGRAQSPSGRAGTLDSRVDAPSVRSRGGSPSRGPSKAAEIPPAMIRSRGGSPSRGPPRSAEISPAMIRGKEGGRPSGSPDVSQTRAKAGKDTGSRPSSKLQSATQRVMQEIKRVKDEDASAQSQHDMNSKIVTINVSGKLFQTYVSTLRMHKGTLLANMVEPGGELLKKGHIFFDRDPYSFFAVLSFYRTDRLSKPAWVSDDQWSEDLEFYKIKNPLEFQMTEEECNVRKSHIPTQFARDFPTQNAQMKQERVQQGMPPDEGRAQQVWLFFEDPASSRSATVMSFFGIFVIVIAVASFMTETHPIFRLKLDREWYGYTTEEVSGFFRGIEAFVVAYFTIELICRFGSTTKKKTFFLNIPNFIDLLAVAPFYVDIMPGVQGGSSLMIVRIFRLTRIFRIIGMVFKLGKYSSGAKVLGTTLLGCGRELLIMGVVFVMAVVIFSSGMFFCENPDIEVDESDFNSVMTGMYFAVITLTTVGYGDMTPITDCGRAVGCACALGGIFCLGLPISVITTKFNEKYQEMLRDLKIEEERSKFLKSKQEISGMRGVRALGSALLERGGASFLGKIFGGIFGSKPVLPEEMSAVQIKQLAKHVFKEFDDDDSGEIGRVELKFAMKKLGFDLQQGAIDYMVDFIDKDGNGQIDFEEFVEFVGLVIKGQLPTDEEIAMSALKANAKMDGRRRRKGQPTRKAVF